MDNFSEAEKIGRDKFGKFVNKRGKVKKVYFTPSKYDKVDVVTFNGATSATTEIKNRLDYSSKSKVIQEEGAVIEKVKYDYLLDTVSLSGMSDCFYSMIFTDDIMYLYDIKRIAREKELKWKTKYLPKTTVEGNGQLVKKEYATLPLDWGIRFEL